MTSSSSVPEPPDSQRPKHSSEGRSVRSCEVLPTDDALDQSQQGGRRGFIVLDAAVPHTNGTVERDGKFAVPWRREGLKLRQGRRDGSLKRLVLMTLFHRPRDGGDLLRCRFMKPRSGRLRVPWPSISREEGIK